MNNLIEKSYEIDNSWTITRADGTSLPMHKIVSVRIADGDTVIYYSIQRTNGVGESYILMQRKNAKLHYNEKTYWKNYDDNAKFERAIKRIERMVSSL
jgi:hypothetical protein